MLEQLLIWDYYWFEMINQKLSNDFLDSILPLWRNRYFWTPVYFFVLVYLIFEYPKRWWIFLIFILASIGLSDLFSSQLIKNWVGRLRPCQNPYWAETINNIVPCGSGKSFTSSHATNHFSLAITWSFLFRDKFPWLWIPASLWAMSIGFGQVYVGVHYPIDVFCGSLLGILIGYCVGTVATNYLNIKKQKSVQ